MKKCPVNIEELYGDYIALKNEENYNERYKGREKYYHGSGAGSCSRKLYFESVAQVDQTNPTDERVNRLLRLGTIVHDDLQTALMKLQGSQILKDERSSDTIYSNTTYSNTIDSEAIYCKEKEIHNLQKESFDFHIEKEIRLPDLNVRGFYDLVAVSRTTGKVYLIDFKTMASYAWSRKFGYKNPDPNAGLNQEIQLGTYGLAVEKEFGRIDGMYLYYYKKDDSRMRCVEVGLHMLKRAQNFWTNVNEDHKKGLPMFSQGISPVEDWNCSYCRYLDHCNPPFFKKK